jgi:ribulose-phosphate 3-epimerase
MCADLCRLGEHVAELEAGGADLLHFDIMDGHFVPNLTFGPLLVRAVKARAKIPVDAHLMVREPDWLLEEFAEAGADYISVHAEAVTHLQRSLAKIRDLGARPGVALNPASSPDRIDYVLEDVDFVLIMSVNPGFAGQSFIPSAKRKIEELHAMILDRRPEVEIWVDGSIREGNIGLLARAGAKGFILGTGLFESGRPLAETLKAFREAAEKEAREAR